MPYTDWCTNTYIKNNLTNKCYSVIWEQMRIRESNSASVLFVPEIFPISVPNLHHLLIVTGTLIIPIKNCMKGNFLVDRDLLQWLLLPS